MHVEIKIVNKEAATKRSTLLHCACVITSDVVHGRRTFEQILDTTQDVSKKDQLSEVFRYVQIDYHDDGTPSELKVVKAFTSFIEIEDSSAIELHKLITNSIQQNGLDIKNCCGQEYDVLRIA